MQTVFKRIALVAPTDACVLITGESGTGKELVARAVHANSPRRGKPFLPVHVAALNPNLVESELFGHVKGAFTGAEKSRDGLLALADGGTVFLDELADIPLPVQAKLLRVLERQEVIPVGGGEAAAGRCAHRLGDARRSFGRSARRPLPQRPVLPPERLPDSPAAAARSRGRHPGAGRALPAQVRHREPGRSAAGARRSRS